MVCVVYVCIVSTAGLSLNIALRRVMQIGVSHNGFERIGVEWYLVALLLVGTAQLIKAPLNIAPFLATI